MANLEFNNFSLPTDGYTAFDATSLKSLIIARLNANNVFTDQNYEGSNLSSIIDIIAYSYHVLLFYLNRTGAEATFTTAELYENINKIVKLIGYDPIGYQTAILSFQATANGNLPAGTYTIPRYSYFTVNGAYYSFNNNITFLKNTNSTEQLTNFQSQNLLYQGQYVEYPLYTANGQPFELLTLTNVDLNNQNTIIDHFNIDVYVKDNTAPTPAWIKYTATQSLFFERANATVYEIRLNENLRYEIKFGNGITGKQLNTGDQVAIYYLKSSGKQGEIGPGILDGNQLFTYSTTLFNQIQNDVTPVNVTLMTQPQMRLLTFANTAPSTPFVDVESVDSIKHNAQNTFRSQYRLITTDDFSNYVAQNFSNIVASVKTVNNWDYITGHLKYFFDLGVTSPNYESRVLFNQVKFADSSNSNNIYIYAVPKLLQVNSLASRSNYVNTAQKQLIINELSNIKLTTSEVIINDPIYVAVDLGMNIPTQSLALSVAGGTRLVITRNITSKRNPEALAKSISDIFTSYFATTQDNLGLNLSLSYLTQQILALEGVDNVQTVAVGADGVTYTQPGVSLIIYNPVYPYDDIIAATQDVQLPYFKYPYLNNASTFVNKIQVVTPTVQLL